LRSTGALAAGPNETGRSRSRRVTEHEREGPGDGLAMLGVERLKEPHVAVLSAKRRH